MTDPFADWPPIIRSARRPKAIFWRDLLLTSLMWGLLFLILYTELAFAFASLEVLLGRSDAEIDAELALFFRRMRPLMWVAGGLIAMLSVATLFSRRRRRRALSSPQPSALPDSETAAIAGLSESALAQARKLKVATVFRDGTSLRVRPTTGAGRD